MFRYTRLGVNLISLFLTIAIFSTSRLVFIGSQRFFQKDSNQEVLNQKTVYKEEGSQKENSTNKVKEDKNSIKQNKIDQNVVEKPKEKSLKDQLKSYEWGIVIEKIGLIAPIQEGTSVEVMNQAVGHFEETEIEKGNVGLAAHNRGYPVNYFQNIKKLSVGDIILYKKGRKTRSYKVEIVTVIKDDDWSYLEKTNENRITLITCVENEPRYRRCIQAVEMEEEK